MKKRVLVFLLLGPTSVVVVWLGYFIGNGSGSVEVAAIVSVLLFLLTWFVAMIALFVDGALAYPLPLPLRAPLTAVAGGVFAGVLFFGTIGWFLLLMNHFFAGMTPGVTAWTLTLRTSAPFVIGGALCMGVCSLLSHDYAFLQRRIARRTRLPSNAG
jgi:hypothetical protein